MVHVPVHDGEALDAVVVLRVARRHGDVVEEAEAHGPIPLGVMPGGTGADERGPGAPLHHGVDRRDAAAGGQQRRRPGALRHAGVGIEPHGRPGADAPQGLDVRFVVDPRQRLERGRLRGDGQEPRQRAAALEAIPDGGQALRPLRVPRPVVVQQAPVVPHEADRRRAHDRPLFPGTACASWHTASMLWPSGSRTKAP
jgi:hypothetical protein